MLRSLCRVLTTGARGVPRPARFLSTFQTGKEEGKGMLSQLAEVANAEAATAQANWPKAAGELKRALDIVGPMKQSAPLVYYELQRLSAETFNRTGEAHKELLAWEAMTKALFTFLELQPTAREDHEFGETLATALAATTFCQTLLAPQGGDALEPALERASAALKQLTAAGIESATAVSRVRWMEGVLLALRGDFSRADAVFVEQTKALLADVDTASEFHATAKACTDFELGMEVEASLEEPTELTVGAKGLVTEANVHHAIEVSTLHRLWVRLRAVQTLKGKEAQAAAVQAHQLATQLWGLFEYGEGPTATGCVLPTATAETTGLTLLKAFGANSDEYKTMHGWLSAGLTHASPFGSDHPLVGCSLRTLGSLFFQHGEPAMAEGLFRSALDHTEPRGMYGKSWVRQAHTDALLSYAQLLASLTWNERSRGVEAVPFFEKICSFSEKDPTIQAHGLFSEAASPEGQWSSEKVDIQRDLPQGDTGSGAFGHAAPWMQFVHTGLWPCLH